MGVELESRLRDALKGRSEGESLRAISRECGVSQPQLSRFLTGERTLTLVAAGKLADYLGLELNPRAEERNGVGPAKRTARKKKSS